MLDKLKRRGDEWIIASAKAIAEVLAIIADAHPEIATHYPRFVREPDEWLWESATEFCAALDRYAGRALQMKSLRQMAKSAYA